VRCLLKEQIPLLQLIRNEKKKRVNPTFPCHKTSHPLCVNPLPARTPCVRRDGAIDPQGPGCANRRPLRTPASLHRESGQAGFAARGILQASSEPTVSLRSNRLNSIPAGPIRTPPGTIARPHPLCAARWRDRPTGPRLRQSPPASHSCFATQGERAGRPCGERSTTGESKTNCFTPVQSPPFEPGLVLNHATKHHPRGEDGGDWILRSDAV